MNFGAVQVATTVQNTLTVQNTGTATLTVTGMSGTNGITSVLTATPSAFSVPAGGKQDVAVRFTPTAATSYSGTIAVNGDQTGGTNTIGFSGSGTLDGIPVFTRSGSGNNVFDIPSHVSRVRVQGHFVDTGGLSNFIVRFKGSLIINEILRTMDYDGIHNVAGGGTIEITNSVGINWTFTEQR